MYTCVLIRSNKMTARGVISCHRERASDDYVIGLARAGSPRLAGCSAAPGPGAKMGWAVDRTVGMRVDRVFGKERNGF